MWMLVRKDLILDRRVFAANLAFYLVLLPAYASLVGWVPPTPYAGFAAVICSIFPLTLVAREDKFRTAALTCSLPVTRDAVVASRYVGGWMMSLAATLAILAAGYLLPWTHFAERGGYPAASFLTAFVIIGLVIAGLVPFTLRFGIVGLIGFLVALQVLGLVAFLAAVVTGGHGALRTVIGGMARAGQGTREALGSAGFAALLVTAVVILNGASLALSRRIYRAREF